MGILTDNDIAYMLFTKQLKIEPLVDPIQPVSVDLHLYDQLIEPLAGEVLDRARGFYPTRVPAQTFEQHRLYPGDFVLGSTLEWVELPPALAGFVVGKSTLARDGLQVEAAGLVDPGWHGRLTFEIYNMSRNTIILRPGMPIGQIYFLSMMTNRPMHLYGDPELRSHYQDSVGPSQGSAGPSSVSDASEAEED